MKRSLDDLLSELRAEPLDPRLNYIGTRVWSAVAQRSSPFAPLVGHRARALWVGAALCVGLVSGAVSGAAAGAQGDSIEVFSTHAALAPSTLLDHH